MPIGNRQSVADLLINVKIRTETSRSNLLISHQRNHELETDFLSRYLTWKAAHCLLAGPGEQEQRRELALEAKVYCSDAAVQSCIDAINTVGV